MSYDNEGQLTAWQNKPSSPTSTDSFLYDGEGNRVAQQSVNGSVTTQSVYVGAVMEARTVTGVPGPGNITYYSASGKRIALMSQGTLSYLVGDHLGSSTLILDSSGNAMASQLYSPFGNLRYSNGTMPTDYGFTGQRADATTGLDYYVARYYDPAIGQFASADSNRDGQNRYGYVGGNPTSKIDPTGHTQCAEDCDAPMRHHGATCDYTCGAILTVYHDRVIQKAIMLLNRTKTGSGFVDYLLYMGQKMGEGFISWFDGSKDDSSGHSYQGGFIAINSKARDRALGDKWLDALVDIAATLVHEAVESYYAVAQGIRRNNSGNAPRMDCVAEWYAGEFLDELGQEDSAAGRNAKGKVEQTSYLQGYSTWINGSGKAYQSHKETINFERDRQGYAWSPNDKWADCGICLGNFQIYDPHTGGTFVGNPPQPDPGLTVNALAGIQDVPEQPIV